MDNRLPLIAFLVLALCLPAYALLVGSRGAAGSVRAAARHTPDPLLEPDSTAGGWHEVRPGETLRGIARHYYGSGRLWRTLQLANDVDRHPPPGSRIWIPGLAPEWD
ncbi:MAG: LysM peptidoglycan-binding domain-containing protein [Planctomycetota bacterium]